MIQEGLRAIHKSRLVTKLWKGMGRKWRWRVKGEWEFKIKSQRNMWFVVANLHSELRTWRHWIFKTFRILDVLSIVDSINHPTNTPTQLLSSLYLSLFWLFFFVFIQWWLCICWNNDSPVTAFGFHMQMCKRPLPTHKIPHHVLRLTMFEVLSFYQRITLYT